MRPQCARRCAHTPVCHAGAGIHVPAHITDHGARGDGTTDNTKAIQTAINAIAKTGGVVTIPEGVYLCGPITLASRVGLHLAKGATLRLPP
ncbi:MAG: hypothetical protein LBM04_08615, partial [Opitutaceae bacterium]|nr:hypothetical protein [Opitutaceae bacterium]